MERIHTIEEDILLKDVLMQAGPLRTYWLLKWSFRLGKPIRVIPGV
jgi:hypothetical protein